MAQVTIEQIEERLRLLPPDQLPVVFDFISYLLDGERQRGEAAELLLAEETSLRKDWDRPEEDAA